MRISSAPRQLDPATAWGCLVNNLMVLPGLGSLAAGRRQGYLQAILALVGMGFSVFWLGSFVRIWAATGTFPYDGGPFLRHGLWGVAIFLAGWIWALRTSLNLLREARTRPGGTGSSSPLPPLLEKGGAPKTGTR